MTPRLAIRRLALLPLVLSLGLEPTGCCGVAPEPLLNQVLPKTDATHALGRFGMYFCGDDWERAYEMLSAPTREQLGYFEFRLGAPFAKDPRTEISILEIICGSVGSRLSMGRHRRDSKLEKVEVEYEGVDQTGKEAFYLIHARMVDEREEGAADPDWKFDLIGTFEELSGVRQ